MASKELTIEYHIKLRHDLSLNFVGLLEDFEESVDFFIRRLSGQNANILIDEKAYIHLINFIKAEGWNIIDRSAKLLNANKNALLPIIDLLTLDFNFNGIDKVEYISSQNWAYEKITNIDSLVDVYKKMRQRIMELNQSYLQRKHNIENDESLFQIIEKALERYIKEKGTELSYYVEEISDPRIALSKLKMEYKDDNAIRIWHEENRDMRATIIRMCHEKCLEHELLPLFDFIAKYSILKEMQSHKERPQNRYLTSLTINAGDGAKINIENYKDNSKKEIIHSLPCK